MNKLNTYLAATASRACGVRETQGMRLGVELELEGPGVGLADEATKGWRRAADGSLRGESIEFVLASPMVYEEAVTAVNHLFSKFKKRDVKFNQSVRTSTHVHLNFSDKPLRMAINFFCLFTMLEEVLEFYSGEDRRGNLFCLSSRRTDEIAQILQTCLKNNSLNGFAGDRYKYAACNLSTLFKFGSVEVRTMRGADTAEQVNKWMAILNDLYVFSVNIESPTDLVIALSNEGADGFLNNIFSAANKAELMSAVPEGFNLFGSFIEGARLVQPMAYEFEEAFRFRPDPSVVIDAPLTGQCLRRDGAGNQPVATRLDGFRWNMQGAEGTGPYFNDREEISDCSDIRWNQALFCFEEYDDDEEEYVQLAWLSDVERFRA